jgi:CelD/BcsL family acetyltransferase involved in cellulose biosynthesis
MSESVQIEVVTEQERLEQIIPAWNSLWEQSGPDSTFLAPEWLATWWKYFHKDKNLCFLTVNYEEEVVGIAPWYLENRLGCRRLKTLGHGFIDYEGILIRKDMKTAVIKTIDDWLLSNNTFDEAVFDRLTSHQWIAKNGLWKQGRMKLKRRPSTISLLTELDKGWEHIRSELPKKFRYDTERQIRRLNDLGDLNLGFVDTVEELNFKFPEFLRCKRDRYDKRYSTNSDVYSKGGFWGDENVASYYKSVAEKLLLKKQLVFSCLMLDKKIISAIFGIERDSTFFYFSTAFRPVNSFSVGRVHLWLLVENLCSRNIKCFDFLIGDDEYKRRWPVSIKHLAQLKLYKTGFINTLRRLGPGSIEKLEHSDMFRRIYKKIKICIS